MNQVNKKWVDPNGRALACVRPKPVSMPESSGSPPGVVRSAPLEGEIVLAEKAAGVKPMQSRDIDSLAMHLENLTDQMVATLNLSKQDFLDKFRTIDGRIAVRIERSGQLAALTAAFGRNIDELRIVAEKLGQLRRVAVLQQLQHMDDVYAMLQKQIRNGNVHEEARERWRIEHAKANFEIAKLEAEAEKARRDALPPPPAPVVTPAPVPPPVDEATRRKEAARQARREKHDLTLDELDEAAQFNQEVVSRAVADATKIYQDIHKLADERFDPVASLKHTRWT